MGDTVAIKEDALTEYTRSVPNHYAVLRITSNSCDRGFHKAHLYHHKDGSYQADRMIKDLIKLPPMEIEIDNEIAMYQLIIKPGGREVEDSGLDVSRSSLEQLLRIDVPLEKKEEDA